MAVVIVTPPESQPVTLAETKDHLRVDVTEHDAMISGYIDAATATVEGWLSRSLVSQTLELVIDCFPQDVVILPRGPVQSVESVTYLDLEQVEMTIDPEGYRLDASNDKYGMVYPVNSWPTAYDAASTVRFRYVAGFPLATPWAIKVAIMLMVGHWYENAEAVTASSMMTVPLGVEVLVAPYRVISV